ncbi:MULTISPECIES: hypothetical protein [Bacillaceae]|uniref:hypothetical protein n=1 Tax=Bacillaceae TaxID=186817 RepID=UPI0001E89D38|nr:hypothetical protein [Bacillus sp. m3-13]
MKREDNQHMPNQSPPIDSEKELPFEEQLKLLSKSISNNNAITNSDQICREVRGKE